MTDERAPRRGWWRRKPLVAAVRLEGVIGTGLSGGLNLRTASGPLTKAFRQRRAAEVAIVVNSPGGSPVQSARLHDHIRWLARHHNKRVTVFVEDIAASGGYWIALAGDEIVAHPSSIVGSIGVVTASFGLDRALERVGVDRRLYATGEHKGMLDPFSPEKAGDVAILEALHRDTFGQFVELVRRRRGTRLRVTDDLFDGRVFSGLQAQAAGLVDATGDPMEVLRGRYGDDLHLKLFAPKGRPWWRRLRGEGAIDLLQRVEERLVWQRYGL